jgi:hypothetical protein
VTPQEVPPDGDVARISCVVIENISVVL